MDWPQLGAILGTVAASAAMSGYGVFKSRTAETRSKEAKVESREAKNMSTATVEVLSPRNDQPSMYDIVTSIKTSVNGLAALLHENRTEYLTAIADVQKDVNALRHETNDRLQAVEVAVNDHHAIEGRLDKCEAALRNLAAPPSERHQ